jgi:hypothetical protein
METRPASSGNCAGDGNDMNAPPASATAAVDEPWHCLAPDEVLTHLAANERGLSAAEAAKRLADHGPNELREAAPRAIFLGLFKNLIVWILIVAGIVSGVLGEVADAIAILAIVVLNAVIGFYQEFSAEKSIAALKRMTAPQAKVWRDGAVSSRREKSEGESVTLRRCSRSGLHPLDVGAESVELFVDQLVAAVDMVDAVYFGHAFRLQAREDERR